MVRARRRSTIGLAAALLALGGLAACEPAPPPATFTVNRFGYGPDAAPGDGTCEVTPGQGDCSLQAAVEEGNATDGPVHIGFVPTERHQTFDTGPLDVSRSMTIEGPARLSGHVGHTDGHLVLREVAITGSAIGDACGSAVRSVGGSLALDRISLNPFAHGSPQPLVCATGALTIVDSSFDGLGLDSAVVGGGPTIVYRSAIRGATVGLDLSGAPSFTIANSTIDGLRTGTSVGDITYTWLTGELGPTSTVRGSIVDCRSTSTATSAGYNLDIGGACGLDAPTDHAPTELPSTIDLSSPPTMLVAHAVDSPGVDAIPAGTPGLCDGTWVEDQKGAPREVGSPCDIGPIEAQVSIDLGTEDHRPVVPDAPVRVNAGGTVAATFPGTGGAPSAVGRWAIDGTFTSSEVAGSRVNDIGDDGTVVGYVIDTDGVRHAWRWLPDGSSELVTGPHGTTRGELFAIDHDGTIVGASEGVPWWQAPGAEPVALPAMNGSPHVAAIRDGIAVGHTGGWQSSATVWHLSAGTATTLPDLTGHPDAPITPSLAFDVTTDGTVIGEIDSDVVAWPGGGSPTLAAAFTSPLTGGVVGSLPIVVGKGNVAPESAILYLLTGHLTEVRLVLGLDPQHLGDGGHLVGTRRVAGPDPTAREVVRLPLLVTP